MTTTPTLNLAPGSDTGLSHTDGITSDTSPVVTGTAQPFATVALSDANGTLGLTTRADRNGNFVFVAAGLAPGVHTLTALAEDAGGTFSAPSAPLDLDVETDATATSTPADVPATATSIVFNVHFDQPVGPLSVTSFVLATTGTVFGNVTSVSGSGEDYAVTATGLGGEGTAALAFSAQGPRDLAGNQVALTSETQPVADTASPTALLVSSDRFGVQGTGASPAISGGGRVVAFISDDAQLTPATTTVAGVGNVYVKDTQTGALALVTNGNDQTYHVAMSLDGTVVAFSSAATNLVPGGTLAGELNLYVARLTAANGAGGLGLVPGSIVRVGVLDSDLSLGSNVDGFALSGDGGTLAFGTDTVLPDGTDTGDSSYAYNLATGAYTLIPGATSGDITSISRDGTKIAFTGAVAVPNTGGQQNPYYGGVYGPDYVQDAFVYDTTAKTTTTIDGTGLLGTVAPTGAGQVASYDTADPQLSGDGGTVVFELQRGGNLSSLYSVGLADPGVFSPVSPGAGTDGSGDHDYDPGVSAGGGVVAYTDDDPTAGPQTEIYTAATHTTTTLGPGFDAVLATQGNAVALSEPVGGADPRGITYEVSLGVSAGIDAIDGNDTIDRIDLAQAAASGLVVSGTSNAPAGSPVLLQVSRAVQGDYSDPVITAVGAGGRWTATLPEELVNPDALPDGYYFLTVQVSATAGASAQVRRLFQVDTAAPAAPSTPVLDPGANSGRNGVDTNVSTPILDGLAEPGTTVILFDNAGRMQLATATVDENGIYTLTSRPLADGSHTLAVEALDEAGNSSPLSGTLTIKVDTVAPDAPSAPALASGDAATNDSTPTLSGTAEANAFVTLYVNNGSLALGTARADANGHYSVTSSRLTDGDYTIAARATDAAGNVGALSDGTALEIDTRAPVAPLIGAVNGQVQPDGSLAPFFDVTGTAGAQTTVTLQVDGVTVAADTAQTRNSGAYDIAVPDLGPGTHTIDVIATDPAGNTSQASATQQVTITAAALPPAGTPPGAALLQGTLTDGPVLGATVFADANGNGVQDPGEAGTVTGADGAFVLANPVGHLQASGGTDVTTGTRLPGSLFAPAGSTVIDPLTTLLYAYQSVTGANTADADAAVTAALGLGAATDLTTLNPYAAVTAGSPALDPGVADGAAQVASAQLLDLATDTADAFGGQAGGGANVFDAVFQVVASQLAALPAGTTLDLSDPVTLLGLIQRSVTLAGFLDPDPTVAAATEQIVAAGNAQLASDLRSSSGQALLGAITAVQAIDAGPAAAALERIEGYPGLAAVLVPQFTGSALVAATFTGTSLVTGAPYLAPGSDTGLSGRDNVTNVSAPTFDGLAVPGAFITLVQEESTTTGQVLGTGRADAFGHYSIASTAIPFSPYGVTVAALGSTADPGVTAGQIVQLPAGVQVQPILFDVPAGYGGFGGVGAYVFGAVAVYSSANDAGDSAVKLRIGVTASGTVQVFADGGTTPVASGSIDSTDGNFTLVTTPLPFGTHVFTAVQTLVGGRVLPANVGYTATIAAPAATTGVARVVGPVAGGTVTQNNVLSGSSSVTPTTTTDGGGTYTATINTRQGGALVLGDGYDTVTGLPLGGYAAAVGQSDNMQGLASATLTAPFDSAGISPLTSLVEGLDALDHNTLGSSDGEAAAVVAALGLPSGTDLSTLDPLAAAQAGDTAPLLATIKLLDAAAVLAGVIGTTDFSAFAAFIAQHQTLDLDDPATLAAVVTGQFPTGLPDTITASGVQALAAIAATGNADLDAHAATATSLADTLAYAFAEERVAQEAVPAALRGAGLGFNEGVDTAALAPVTAAYTGVALDAAVTAAEHDTTQATSFVPTGPASTNAARVTFRITFSQAVTGLTAGAFTPVVSGDLRGAAVTGVAQVAGSDGTAFDVSVSTGAGNGTLALAYAGDGVDTATGAPITSGTLAPSTTFLPLANITRGSAVAVGDLNGDGRPDAVLLSTSLGLEVTPFLNTGNGQFAAEAPISPDAGADDPASPVIADMTGDGKADLVMAEYDPDVAGGYAIPTFGDTVTVLPGNGDGTFAQPVNTALGFVPGQIAVGDLNGDGRPDVAVTDYNGNKVHVLLGDGAGGFTAAGTYAVGSNPYGVVAADLNGDGRLDLAVTNRSDNTVSILLGAGDGTFVPAATPAVAAGNYPVGIAAADLNGDGIPDLVVADPSDNGYDPADPTANAVAVLLGQGGGAFAAPAFFSFTGIGDLSGLSPDSLAVGDLNNDGVPDLAVEGRGFGTETLLGNGDGTFRLWQQTPNGTRASDQGGGVALADVDGDGRLDVLVPGVDTAPTDATVGGLTVLANEAQEVVGSTSAAVTIARAALAQPVLQQAGGGGTLTQSGTAYTLDLGRLAQGAAVTPLLLALANMAAAGSDSFDGTFSAAAGSGFAVTGADLPVALAPGQSYAGLGVTVDTGTIGRHTVTLTFAPRDETDDPGPAATAAGVDGDSAAVTLPPADANGTDISRELAPITLTVTDDVLAGTGQQAAALGFDTTALVLPNVRVGAADTAALTVSNAAGAGAAGLDVTLAAAGDATASGSVAGLAAGATDASSLVAGLRTAAAGLRSGTVTLDPVSDSAGIDTPLAPQTVAVSGSVFRPAAAAVAPVQAVMHVGDPGTVTLAVANTDPADGYSERLLASLSAVPGRVTGTRTGTGSTAGIAAGARDTSLTLTADTSAAAVISGTAAVSLLSDGGTGQGGIDGLGQLALGTVQVPVAVTIDNYAAPVLSATLDGTVAAITGDLLDLGTLRFGSGPVTVALTEANIAAGPADLLAATFTSSTGTGFTDALGGVSGLGAGQAGAAGTVTLSTDAVGTFTETITATATGSNAGGYSGALPAQTLTITGTVAVATSPTNPTPPVAPSILLVAPIDGTTAAKAITDTATPTVTGTAGLSDTVSVTSPSGVASTVSRAADGFYRVGLPALGLGADTLSVAASNAAGTTPGPQPASAYVLPAPVAGASTPDLASIDIGRLFDAGYAMQFTADTEAVALVDGVLSVGPDTQQAYVQRLYEGLLGRGGELGGTASWNAMLGAGVSKADVAGGFLVQPEFVAAHGSASTLAPGQFVALLYQGFLGRAPSDADVAGWVAQVVQSGQASVLAQIADSPEAKFHLAADTAQVWAPSVTGTLTDELYATGLGREPELGGTVFRLDVPAGMTTHEAVEAFVVQPEFVADHAGQDAATYARSLYEAGLGRDPTVDETQGTLVALQSGAMSRADLLLQVATSPEAAAHLTRNLGGISPPGAQGITDDAFIGQSALPATYAFRG